MYRFRQKVAGRLALFLLAVCLSGCATDKQPPVTIGIIAPTTGIASVYGMASSNGSKLAVAEVNKNGGVWGREVQVVLRDDHHDPVAAAQAYQKLVTWDQAVAVIGAVTSEPAAAVAEAAQENPTLIITPSATAEGITDFGDFIFRACYRDGDQSRVMAEFALKELNAYSGAVLYNKDDDYSSGLAEGFARVFEANGGRMLAVASYGADEKDFASTLTVLQQKKPDVLYLPDYANPVALITAQARESGLDAIFLGADGWDGILDLVDDRKVLEGAYYCAHYAADDSDEVVRSFIQQYEALYNQTPNSLAALGYDAAKIVLSAIESAGSSAHEDLLSAMRNTQYRGVTGDISFDESGNPVKTINVIQVRNEEAKLYKKLAYTRDGNTSSQNPSKFSVVKQPSAKRKVHFFSSLSIA